MMEHNPERFYRISDSQLSIARHYGGCRYNGKYYVYNPADDTLTRQDIWTAGQKAIKAANKAQNKPLERRSDGETGGDLFNVAETPHKGTGHTCGQCESAVKPHFYRPLWMYCEAKPSKRTQFGVEKIKSRSPACRLFVAKDKTQF